MEGKRIIGFLIMIFAVLTVIFYGLYYTENKSVTVLEEQFVSEAVENLSRHNVAVDEKIIERNIPEGNIYIFNLQNDSQYRELVIQAFSHWLDAENNSFTMLDTPTGLSVTFHAENDKEQDNGKLVFDVSSPLDFTYSVKGNSISANTGAIYNEDTELDDSIQEKIMSLVNELSAGKNMGCRLTGSVDTDRYKIVSAVQTFNGREISGVYLNFVFEDTSLVNVIGKWIPFEPSLKYHEKMTDGINVLYKLNLDEVAAVLDENLVYLLRKGDNNTYYILPCWEIIARNKNGNVVKSYFEAL